jgi:hypothetical protein
MATRRATMIKTVIRLRNNIVMVFDARGEQIPAYQGPYDDVRDRILRDAPPGAIFNHWFGHSPEARTARKW